MACNMFKLLPRSKLLYYTKVLIQNNYSAISTCNVSRSHHNYFHHHQSNGRKIKCFFLKDLHFSISSELTSLRLQRSIHTCDAKMVVHEFDRKGGYGRPNTMSRIQMVREGFKELKKEIVLWTEEVKEDLKVDPILIFRPDEVDVVWKFGSPEVHSKWVTTADSDHNEGLSKCELTVSQSGNALFSGTLNTQVPRDGRIKKAGYCNMRSIRARKSFKRDSYLDWSVYTHLVLRVRGDGRSYMINLATSGSFDILWNDIYNYILYTRGGPYWQIAKIPFSKFFLSSKGRIQDKQAPISLNRITNVGISVGDKINGPFNLEIDYIGVEFDPSHTEEFAYEMYRLPKFIAGN